MLFKGKKTSTVNILCALVSDGKLHLYMYDIYIYIYIQINTYAKKLKFICMCVCMCIWKFYNTWIHRLNMTLWTTLQYEDNFTHRQITCRAAKMPFILKQNKEGRRPQTLKMRSTYDCNFYICDSCYAAVSPSPLKSKSKIRKKQPLVHYEHFESILLFQDHTNSILTLIIIIRDMRGFSK